MAIELDDSKRFPVRAQPADEFCEALRTMQVGQSFVYRMRSYERLGIALAGKLLDRTFTTKAEGKDGMCRIWRVT